MGQALRERERRSAEALGEPRAHAGLRRPGTATGLQALNGVAQATMALAGKRLPAPLERKRHRAARRVEAIAAIGQEPVSLSAKVHDGVLPRTLGRRLPSDLVALGNAAGNEPDLGDLLENELVCYPIELDSSLQLLREQLDVMLEALTDRERIVVESRYGLNDRQRLTLEELGKSFGLTRERIRQLQERALRKLKHPANIAKLRGYFNLWEVKRPNAEVAE